MPIKDKKLVVCTPAGRAQYMRVLAPRILSDQSIDRWDIWVNTDHRPDLEYIKELCQHPKCRPVILSAPVLHPVSYRIHKFFPHATDEDTVYIRLDDDIVYYHPGSVLQLAEYRLSNPHPFLVYGNVLNTALTSREHQQKGRIPFSRGTIGVGCMDEVGWGSPVFARQLHQDFLSDPHPSSWQLPDITLGPPDYLRQSINVISWTGADAKNWAHTMIDDEEAWLAHQEPKRQGRPNVIAGSCGPFVHYAFWKQRENGLLDDGLLTAYSNLQPIPGPYERLSLAAEKISKATQDELTSEQWLIEVICSVGLYNDGREMYGIYEYAKARKNVPGLWQHPEEFAKFLIWCSTQNIKSVIEVGCFYGFMSVITESYLRRFSPLLHYVAVDNRQWITSLPSSTIEYHPNTNSSKFIGIDYDMAIIDADHNYPAALADYMNLNNCSLVIFHDINDDCVRREAIGGGVPTLYQELKKHRFGIEFLRSDSQRWMGLGVLT